MPHDVIIMVATNTAVTLAKKFDLDNEDLLRRVDLLDDVSVVVGGTILKAHST